MARVPVWDQAVRLFHWSLVGGVLIAWFADGEWMSFHIMAGYLVFVLIAFRVVWGFVGTAHARFSDFVRGPGVVLRYLGRVLTLRATRFTGHNPAGGAMIVALLLALMVTCSSGVLLYGGDAWLGPMAWLMKHADYAGVEFLDRVHSVSADVTMILVLVHVGGVLWESVLHRENLIAAMISGYKPLHTRADRSVEDVMSSNDSEREKVADTLMESVYRVAREPQPPTVTRRVSPSRREPN